MRKLAAARSSLVVAAAAALGGCGGEKTASPSAAATATATASATDSGTASVTSVVTATATATATETATSACTGSQPVTSMADAVALINALPRPVTLPCFLEAVDRPVAVVGTTSRDSAQPADTEKNPRMFIVRPGFFMSVVPSGRGAGFLELSETVGETQTVKAEIKFPVEEDATLAGALERGKGCEVFCHLNATTKAHPKYGDVYVTDALQPRQESLVTKARLTEHMTACIGDMTARCEVIRALLGSGIEAGSFPAAFGTR